MRVDSLSRVLNLKDSPISNILRLMYNDTIFLQWVKPVFCQGGYNLKKRYLCEGIGLDSILSESTRIALKNVGIDVNCVVFLQGF